LKPFLKKLKKVSRNILKKSEILIKKKSLMSKLPTGMIYSMLLDME
jgi:hypothetical protein